MKMLKFHTSIDNQTIWINPSHVVSVYTDDESRTCAVTVNNTRYYTDISAVLLKLHIEWAIKDDTS